MSTNVSDEQFQLLCLLHIAEEAMRELLGDLLKNQTLTQKKSKTSITTDQHDAGVALSQILNFIQGLNDIETHFHRTSSKIYHAIFTTNSGGASSSKSRHFTVKPTIDLKTFDISALYYFLTSLDLEFLPTRKAIFRKKDGRLSCQGPAHLKKCCTNCMTASGKLHGADSSQPCSSCSTSHHECYNDHTPCCLQCMTCDACAALSYNKCDNREVRCAIDFLHNVRNLNAHSNQQTYNDLQAATFIDDNFPGCFAWSALWLKSSNHLIKLLSFLHTNGIIDQTTYYTRCDEVKSKLPKKTKAELSQTYSEVLLDLCDEFKRMFTDSEQRASNLANTVSSLTETVSEVSQLRQTVSDLKKNVSDLTLPKCFNIKFLLSADVDSCWKMVNDFLGLEQTLSKEDLTLRSEFSSQLTKYIETVLTGFLTEHGSISIALEDIKYNTIESGYLYQFVVTPKEGNVIPKNWHTEIKRDSAVLEGELRRCIQNAILADKKVETKIHVYHITFGSLVFTALLSGTAPDSLENVCDLSFVIEDCRSHFSHSNAQLTTCSRMENSKYLSVSCDVSLNYSKEFEKLLHEVEKGISYLTEQVRGPIDAATIKKRTLKLKATLKTDDVEDEPLPKVTRLEKEQKMLPHPGDTDAKMYQKDFEDYTFQTQTLPQESQESGTEMIVRSLQTIELPFAAMKNIYLWYHGKVSGRYCAKVIVDTAGTLVSAGAGGTLGATVGSVLGPAGVIAGGALGAIVGHYTGKAVIEEMTCKIFDLPQSAALDNAYRYLGVDQHCSNETINEAYRMKSRSTHPDHGGNHEAFLELQYHMGIIKVARGEVY